MADRAVLRNELLIDPLNRGYAGMSNQQKLDDLHTVYQTRERAELPTWEIFEALVLSEVTALTTAQREILQGLLAMGSVNIQGANTRQAFLDLFAAGSTTRANLATLQTEAISRATELNWGGATLGDIERALA